MTTRPRSQAGNAWSSIRWLLLLVALVGLAAWQVLILHRHDFALETSAAGNRFMNGFETLEAQAAQAVHPDGKVGKLLLKQDPKVVIASLEHDLSEKTAENNRLKAELEQTKLKEQAAEQLLKIEQVAAKPGGFLAPKSETNGMTFVSPAARPYYDIVALILSTASAKDVKRWELAEKTWLSWHGKYTASLTITHVYALCQGDPGTQCHNQAHRNCPTRRHNVVVLPCKHSYAALIAKSTTAYRYVADNFNFSYLLKADVDSIMDVACTIQKIKKIPPSCRSWGLGLWRIARDSKVFDNEPGAGKYANPAYKRDTGNDWYPPYMTGWAFVWSGDVARFLGMGGLPTEQMPVWRDTWTIEDAAIGTFIAGLDICRISLASVCPIWTDMEPADYPVRDLILASDDEDKLAEALQVNPKGEIRDLEGPHKDDDIPGLGDLANVQAKSLKHCAAKCFLHAQCRSFEYSATIDDQSVPPLGNCQLVSRKWPRAGRKFRDYHLYIRLDV
mmetsp:Transcript_21690/g.38109  ORF Transcript_21690/g.38109 Transcript_21690/m.38109 type:complete len:503 (-) Transcript_21690:156-1664(-)